MVNFAPYATDDKPRAPIAIAQTDIYNEKGEVIERIITDESWRTHPVQINLLVTGDLA